MKPSRIFLAALALAGSAAFAGTADVRFIDPGNFSDLATNQSEEQEAMRALTRHIERLAARLPADQRLRVDILDVDRAGTWRETRRGRVRTATNKADPPKIRLRYTLESQGRVLRTGEDYLTDLDYAHHLVVRQPTTYYFETRLLDEWFARTFGTATQYSAR